ncbi:hypothetical protein EHO98_05015 [Leptospira stimsonii]|uniref:KH type-2 domain-containing protein n=1 Tax=Leptospira stimsonii TaxID=2202203 RepID=A0ABY2MWB5_9LEPT|nr:hypothetical protein EHO98_05015 [Leptospira stimsonii]TGM10260.1 hypothetical protein EHQ90_19185 [Leptospira stimsonii]
MLLSPLRPDVSVGVVFRKDSKDRFLGFRGSNVRSAMILLEGGFLSSQDRERDMRKVSLERKTSATRFLEAVPLK